MATENKNLSNYDKATIPNSKDFRFGIVVSEWNDAITEGLFQGAFDALTDCGVLKDPSVELIFVDYHGFLGLPPDQLETPLSLPKNAPDNTLNFNFGQGGFRQEKQGKVVLRY